MRVYPITCDADYRGCGYALGRIVEDQIVELVYCDQDTAYALLKNTEYMTVSLEKIEESTVLHDPVIDVPKMRELVINETRGAHIVIGLCSCRELCVPDALTAFDDADAIPAAPARPDYGAPCNGCGICCQEQVCGFGTFVLGLGDYGTRAPGPCPALVRADDNLTCGIVARPKDYTGGRGSANDLRNTALLCIGAGAGCDSDEGRENAITDTMRQALVDRYLLAKGERRLSQSMGIWFDQLGSRKNGGDQ